MVERPPSESDSDSVLSDASESDSDEDEEPPPVPQRPENTRSIYTKSLIGRIKLIMRYLMFSINLILFRSRNRDGHRNPRFRTESGLRISKLRNFQQYLYIRF